MPGQDGGILSRNPGGCKKTGCWSWSPAWPRSVSPCRRPARRPGWPGWSWPGSPLSAGAGVLAGAV